MLSLSRWVRRRGWLSLVAVGTVFQLGACSGNLSPADQAQLAEQLDQIRRRQITNIVTDSVFFFLDNAVVRRFR